MKNYFQYHGSAIYNNERLILENASFDGFEITKHFILTDGTFLSEKANNSWTFIYNKELYYFLASNHGQINSFFKLNMSKQNCIDGKNGVYYSLN